MQEILAKALPIAEEAGNILMKYWKTGIEFRRKQDDTLVSRADTEADSAWISSLEEAFPGCPILTEESFSQPDMEKLRGKVWVVDPLDGTSSFKNMEDCFSTMAALVENRRIVFGIVHAPAKKETYWAFKGKGAFLNGKKIHVSPASRLEEMRLVRRHTLSNNLEKIVSSLPVKEIAVSGSLGLKLSLIASGQYDLTVYDTEPSLWDILPGKIILEEAGGTVTDIFGKEISLSSIKSTGIVASNGAIHQELLGKIQPLSFLFTRKKL